MFISFVFQFDYTNFATCVCYNICISWEKGGNGIWKFQIGIHNGSGMTGITLLCTINYHYQRMYNLIDK